MSQLEIGSSRNNRGSPRSREDRAQLAKYISEIVMERAIDGNPVCVEIFQKARRLSEK
jgi:hypothetical protein